MKTFSHAENRRFKLVRVPSGEHHWDSLIGASFTLKETKPCLRMITGNICKPEAINGQSCPGVMKMKEDPFSSEFNCFGFASGSFALEEIT